MPGEADRHAETFEVEGYGAGDKVVDSPDDISAHNMAKDNPWEVGFQLATAIDNAFILGYPFLIMSFLGWVAGSILFIGGGVVSLYANILLARLAVIDGKRYFRFRDISYAVFGTPGFWITVILQWGNILAGNVGLVILMGQALKGVYKQYHSPESGIKLPEWMIFAGLVLIVLAMIVPDLHYLRLMAVVAAGCSIVYSAIVIGISAHDGARNPPRHYETGRDETIASKWFNALGSVASIAFAYSTVIIPEIQATVRDPPVQNFYKSYIVNYGIGAPIFLIVSFVAFWAYGSGFPDGVAPNIIDSLSGPKWAIVLAWCTVFVEAGVSFCIYASPVYETVDTAFTKPGGPWAIHNVLVRMVFRIPYVILTTLVAALLPFFGDFIALIGSLTVLPCNFVLTFMLHAEVNKKRMPSWDYYLHWFLAFLFTLITGVAAVASLRYIIVDSINYSVFANI